MDRQADKLSERSVVDLLSRRAEVSVAELADELALPASTTVGILSRLVDKGSVARHGAIVLGRGRPSFRYGLRLPAPLAAFQFDGSQLAGALFGAELDVRCEETLPLTPVKDAQAALLLVRDMLHRLTARAGLASKRLYGVAMSVNAIRTPGGTYASSVLPWVDGKLEKLFSRELGLPTRLVRPPQLLAEYQLLPAPRPRSIVYFHVGDGVSAHWSAFGRAARGHTRRAGELGHVVVETNGPRCGCGRRGCLEALCSGPAIAHAAAKLVRGAGNTPGSDTCSSVPARETIERIWQAWKAGDAPARSLMEGVLDHLAWGLGLVVNLIDPELVVAGGYVLAGKAQWIAQIRKRSGPWILHDAARPLSISPARATVQDELRVIATQYHADRQRRAGASRRLTLHTGAAV